MCVCVPATDATLWHVIRRNKMIPINTFSLLVTSSNVLSVLLRWWASCKYDHVCVMLMESTGHCRTARLFGHHHSEDTIKHMYRALCVSVYGRIQRLQSGGFWQCRCRAACPMVIGHRASSPQPAGAQHRQEGVRSPLLCRCELPARPYKAHISPPSNWFSHN